MKIEAEQQKLVFTIYVGLNDKNEYQQLIETHVFNNIIKRVCRGYHVSYSMYLQQGGYIHDNGHCVEETSAALRLIGASQEVVNEIAADLCCFCNQESVLVECSTSTYYLVSESIDLEDCT